MMNTPTRWTALNFLLPGRVVRVLWAWSFMIVLLCGLTFSQSASAFATADHHAQTSVEASDGLTGLTSVSLSCDPALVCAAVVLPIGAVTAFTPSYAVVSRPNFAQTQLLFGGPSVSLPPPRLLI